MGIPNVLRIRHVSQYSLSLFIFIFLHTLTNGLFLSLTLTYAHVAKCTITLVYTHTLLGTLTPLSISIIHKHFLSVRHPLSLSHNLTVMYTQSPLSLARLIADLVKSNAALLYCFRNRIFFKLKLQFSNRGNIKEFSNTVVDQIARCTIQVFAR